MILYVSINVYDSAPFPRYLYCSPYSTTFGSCYLFLMFDKFVLGIG